MKISKRQMCVLKWIVKLFSVFVLAFGLFFYFGYGNPLPFSNTEYSFLDNIWLICLPLIFIGLLVGLKYEKFGAFLIIIPTIVAGIIGLISMLGFPGPIFVPLIIGFFYLYFGYEK